MNRFTPEQQSRIQAKHAEFVKQFRSSIEAGKNKFAQQQIADEALQNEFRKRWGIPEYKAITTSGFQSDRESRIKGLHSAGMLPDDLSHLVKPSPGLSANGQSNSGRVVPVAAPQPLAPKTLDDFKAAHAAALANRKNSSGKSNSSRLSQDQLMANAAAYNARKQAEAAARFDRRMMGQQVRNYKNMAGLGYNDPVFVQPGVSPEAMLEADMNRQRMGMQQQYMDRDFGLRERSLGQTANEAREAARLARLQLAADAANRNRQFNLDQKRLGIEQSSADSEADYRNKQIEAVAAQFGFDKEKYRDAKNKVDQDASMPSLPPALAILVKSGRMTQQQAVDVIENEMIRAEVGNDKQAVLNILKERGYSPQEIARKFEAITRINKEIYDARSSTWWDRWKLPSIPEPNVSNFPPGYVQP